jgi:hypothetical protein
MLQQNALDLGDYRRRVARMYRLCGHIDLQLASTEYCR